MGKFLHVVGARPNFMKAAPVIHALGKYPEVRQVLVHTGQHYDLNMSDVFFRELEIPHPDFNLQVGSGSHAVQTAEIMARFEPVLTQEQPDWVIVYGDVNSTIAAALVCAKLSIKVAHVEAGLRSFDRTMPEEINRLLTDQLCDLLFTPSVDGNANLKREGVPEERICFVGNVMIDTLIHMLPAARRLTLDGVPAEYALITLHRPANVDDADWLNEMLSALSALATDLPIVFPVHPRTRQRMQSAGLSLNSNGILFMDPVPYLTFLSLQTRARLVITDSGGIQEETTYLRVPCLTVRDSTERPITIQIGTNHLVGRNIAALGKAVSAILTGTAKQGMTPPLWDGHAGERIADILSAKI